jgi:hypothetical protein
MTTQASGDDVVFVCGSHQSEGSDRIVTESAYEATDSAGVVLPAVPDDRRDDLPEGTSLPSISEAEETVGNWLAGK